MTSEDTTLGVLIQRSLLPASAGMDAIEARLIVLQEVPPKGEVRFYAVRGDLHEQLTNDAALSVLRSHVPSKPVTKLSCDDLMIEVTVLRAEIDHMRPIYLAAKEWRRRSERCTDEGTCGCPDCVLGMTVDAAVAKDNAR